MADSLQLLAKFAHLFCLCVLFLSFNTYKYCVHGARELATHQLANQKKPLMTASPYSASTTGPRIVPYGQSRARSLASTPPNDFPGDVPGLGTKLPLQKSSLNDDNFVVKVGFGTPKRDLTLLFDTGSFLTWIQCLPCHNCYDQEEPIFDPSMSSTFSNATCKTPTCLYTQEYHDKSYSKGYYASDTLTFSSVDVFPKVVFGCGQDSSATFGRVAGVLGIGQGKASVMSQTMENFGQLFCYCLPSDNSLKGYVVFGVQALQICEPEFSIPLIPDLQGSGHYYVSLVGITIGGKRLEMSSNVASNSLSSTIIDSGTIISRLPESVYSLLRSAFDNLMSKYPRAPPSNLMDTCYNLEGFAANSSNTIPSMILHFADSKDMNLDPSAVVLRESDSQVCLAFAPNNGPDDLVIIGNHQQRNVNIYFNILDKQVGFNMNGCNN